MVSSQNPLSTRFNSGQSQRPLIFSNSVTLTDDEKLKLFGLFRMINTVNGNLVDSRQMNSFMTAVERYVFLVGEQTHRMLAGMFPDGQQYSFEIFVSKLCGKDKKNEHHTFMPELVQGILEHHHKIYSAMYLKFFNGIWRPLKCLSCITIKIRQKEDRRLFNSEPPRAGILDWYSSVSRGKHFYFNVIVNSLLLYEIYMKGNKRILKG